MIKSSIRTSLAKSPNNICAIVIGSALKNKGIQPLLNTIIDYLPSPDQKLPRTNLLNPKEIRIPSRNEKLLAFAYKVVMDKQKGPLVYVRLYAGKIAHRTQLKNVSREITEKPHHLYRVRANSYVNLTEVSAGDIAAISGLKFTKIVK